MRSAVEMLSTTNSDDEKILDDGISAHKDR
jgi:hypothetical protein